MESTTPAPRSRIQRGADTVLIALFLAVMTVPSTLMLLRNSEAELERTEQRRAAPFPSVRYEDGPFGLVRIPRQESLREFPRAFESWFNDHLGGRRQFLQGYNLAKVSGLTTENLGRHAVGQSAGQVTVGRNGWLFYAGDRLIEDYRRTSPFTPEELENWKRVLDARQEWLAQRGIHYVVMMAPNAQTIYADQMPRLMNRVRPQSRFDQLQEYLKQNGSIEIIDPRPTLCAGKAQYPTYHKTDTHWNDYGAFLAYQLMMQRIAQRFPEAQPRPLSDFKVSVSEGDGQFLSTIIDSPFPFREQWVKLAARQPQQFKIEVTAPPGSGRQRMESTCPPARLPNAVVIHDSFFTALVPHFCEHFQKVHFEWTFDFPADVIERERPVVVVQEFVERRLLMIRPENPPEVQSVVPRVDIARKALAPEPRTR